MLIMSGCQSEYEKMRRLELASGERQDSLFMGLYLGMPRQAFYDRCTELNRQKKITNNGDGRRVQYYIEGEDPEIIMNFFPTFQDERIVEMPVEMHYAAWSPWSKEYWSDKLLLKMVSIFEDWYGKGFIKVEDEERGVIYVKIDGNRQIVLGTRDEQFVKANFTDLRNPLDEKKKETEAPAQPKTTSQTAR